MKGIPQHGLLAAFSSCPLAPASINATLCKALGGLSTFYFRKVCSFHEPRRDPQCCLCNFLAGQPENGWPLEGKYCILPNPSRESGESGLHVQVPYNMYEKSISQWTCWTGGRHPMPARSPPADDIPSRATELPETMFAAVGVTSAGHLGPNNSFPKAVNVPPG